MVELKTAVALINKYPNLLSLPTDLEFCPQKKPLQKEIDKCRIYPGYEWTECLWYCLKATRFQLRRNPDEARQCYNLALCVRSQHRMYIL